MAKTIGVLSVTLISLVFFTSLVVSTNVTGDIEWWCNKTPYPGTCKELMKSSHGSFVSKEKSAFRNLAVKVIMERASSAMSRRPKCRNEKEKAAWADCLQLYENIIMQLNQTGDTNYKVTDVDAQTWLSTALTNLETCREGFMELGATDYMQPLMSNNVTKFICNMLAINDVGFEQGNVTGGFPIWVAGGDRKLLQRSPRTSRANIIVAKDGSGNFRTIKEAIDAAARAKRGSARFVIHVKKGVYKENIQIGFNMRNIMLFGDGMRRTIITGSRSVGGGHTTVSSATVGVIGEGFIARGITFRNTAGPQNHQAVALLSGSDLSVFYQCGFEGYQNTLYVHSQRQFYRECYIYGTVDFIFGNAAVVLQNCMIYARRPMRGQMNVITAQGRIVPNQNTGISIHNSRVMAAPDLRPVLRGVKTYLGRPWKEYSRTVYLQTYIDGLVDGAGWLEWEGNFALNTLYYGEYRNMGPGSRTARRIRWRGYHVIRNPVQASHFSVGNFIAGRAWLPASGVPFTRNI